ncbi:MAG: DUF2341 domain-containing protein [Chitinivibrionales bacterium]|nr:DUF2341 domain-containing protein [Chitinivibrionales bacterium]
MRLLLWRRSLSVFALWRDGMRVAWLTMAILCCIQSSYAQFNITRRLFINTTGSGAATTAGIADYPLLLRLDSSNFDFSTTQKNGEDIRFRAADGSTPLPYEIERWDSAGAKAEIWIRIDTIKANDSTQFVYLLWQNDAAVDSSTPSSVFDTANGFLAVWHFNQTGESTRRDATGNANHAEPRRYDPSYSDIDGVIDGADSLGGNDYLVVPELDLSRLGAEYRISAWIQRGQHRNHVMLMSDSGNVHYLSMYFENNRLVHRTTSGGSDYSGAPIADAGWNFVAAAYDGTEKHTYVNESKNSVSKSMTAWDSVVNFFIAAEYANAGSGVNALGTAIDEMRIESKARSTDWHKLSYRSQKRDQNIVFLEPDSSAPTIVSQPQSDTVADGGELLLSVAANGYPALSYQWYKNGSPISRATSASYRIAQATLADSGHFYAEISNSLGSVTSSTAAIAVLVLPPDITVQPRDTTVVEGSNVFFAVDVAGSKPMSFSWQKVGESKVGDVDTLKLVNVQAADDGSRYYCEIANDSATVQSATVTLNVVAKVNAFFTPAPGSGQDSIDVSFSDASTGNIQSWEWRFGEDSVLSYTSSDKPSSITYRYNSLGTFYCTLIVVGVPPAGADTAVSEPLHVYAQGGNPLSIIANNLSTSLVQIKIRNIGEVSTDPLEPPYAEKIGVWWKSSGLPIDPSSDSMVIEYDIGSLPTGSDFVDTLRVPASVATPDTAYGFWVSPIWNDGPSIYARSNAAYIYMRPVYAFEPTFAYSGNSGDLYDVVLNRDALDSGIVSLGPRSSFDDQGVAEIIVMYKSSPTTIIGAESISTPDYLAGVQNDFYPWAIEDNFLQGDTHQVYIGIALLGKNGLSSDTADTSFLTGWPRAETPAKNLTGDALRSDQVQLNWEWQGDRAGIDSVRVIYSTDPLPLYSEITVPFQSLHITTADTSAIIDNLQRQTTYSFGLQIKKNLLWSNITPDTRVTGTTPDFTNRDTLPNTISITSAQFDSATNQLIINWQVPAPYVVSVDSFDYGYKYGLDSAGVVDRATAPDSVRDLGALTFTTRIRPDALVFDTTYFVSLWIKGLDGPWSPPADSSFVKIALPDFTWQVSSFDYTTGKADTVKAFNDKVWLIKDAAIQLAPDTVRYVRPPADKDSLIPVGPGMQFSYVSYTKLKLGIRYDSLPTGRWQDIGMYRDSSDKLLVVHGFTVDTINKLVLVTTEEFYDDANRPTPYYVMADPHVPTVSFETDTGSTVEPGKEIGNTLVIDDNIDNVFWKVLYAKGSDSLSESTAETGYYCGTCMPPQTLKVSIPGALVNAESGVRAVLIISDGVHVDSVDLSRRVKRDRSDLTSSEELAWMPVAATSELDNTDAATALKSVMKDSTAQWKYDTKHFRLYKYHAPDDADQKWLEYNSADKSLFVFKPGRLFWLKMREAKPIHLGPGKTLSLKDTAEITLSPLAWTDFALPFKFDIVLNDIFQASEAGISDSLEMLKWRSDEVDGKKTYVAAYVYSRISADTSYRSKSSILERMPNASYTVYSSFGREVTLKIPPTPYAMSPTVKKGLAKQKAIAGGWQADVAVHDRSGRIMSHVYCGHNPELAKRAWVPLPPTFSPIYAGVLDESRAVRSTRIDAEPEQGGFAFEIALVNTHDRSESLRLHTRLNSSLPQGFVCKIFNPLIRDYELSIDKVNVALEEFATAYRWLVVGDEHYLQAFKTSLFKDYRLALVNSFVRTNSRLLRIRYSIPYSSISRVKLQMLDVRGRLIWERHVEHKLTPGIHEATWDGTSVAGHLVGSGSYILRMQAYGASGKKAGDFRRVISWLP